MKRWPDWLPHAVSAALVVGFLCQQAVIVRAEPGLLDADGHLVRTANAYTRLRTGDVGLSDQLGTPSWGEPAVQLLASSAPYPGGYVAAWLPVVAISEGAPGGMRAYSSGLVAVGIVLGGLLAAELAGAWAAVGTIAALVGMPVMGALAGSCAIDTLLFPLVLLACWALVRGDGFRRAGSGVGFGLVMVLALSVRWTAAPLVVPLALLAGLRVLGAGRTPGVLWLAALVLGSAVALGGALTGRWAPGDLHPLVPGAMGVLAAGGALVVAARARRAGEGALMRLATAVALVLGPGLAWYWLHAEAVALYVGSQRQQATAVSLGGAVVVAWGVLGQLGTGYQLLLPLGFLAALRARRRPEALALVGTGFVALFALVGSGSPELFTMGSIGARLLLGPASLLALAIGLLVAGAGRRAPWAALPVVVLAVWTAWSFRVPLCAPKMRDYAVYRICGGTGPMVSWAFGTPNPGPARRIEEVLEPASSPRIVAVLTVSRRLWRADEGPYVRALLRANRAVTVVEVEPEGVGAWLEAWRDRVDDVVLVGLPGAVATPFPTVTTMPLDLGPKAPRATLLVGPGRSGIPGITRSTTTP